MARVRRKSVAYSPVFSGLTGPMPAPTLWQRMIAPANVRAAAKRTLPFLGAQAGARIIDALINRATNTSLARTTEQAATKFATLDRLYQQGGNVPGMTRFADWSAPRPPWTNQAFAGSGRSVAELEREYATLIKQSWGAKPGTAEWASARQRMAQIDDILRPAQKQATQTAEFAIRRQLAQTVPTASVRALGGALGQAVAPMTIPLIAYDALQRNVLNPSPEAGWYGGRGGNFYGTNPAYTQKYAYGGIATGARGTATVVPAQRAGYSPAAPRYTAMKYTTYRTKSTRRGR